MLTPSNKLYIQLKPSDDAIDRLCALQSQLTHENSMRLVTPSALHVTILHIGLISKLIQAVQTESSLNITDIMNHIEVFTRHTVELVKSSSNVAYSLSPAGLELFGHNHSTVVLRFDDSPELSVLHARGLATLRVLLGSCRIKDVDAFMASDPNLRYALSLKPHITVAKSFHDELKTKEINFNKNSYNFDLTPVIY